MMKYTTFGRSGLRVSEAFLGTMGFGVDWGWGASLEECRKIFTAYTEAGGNVIDTANRYTEGSSERIVGELISAERDRFVVATKYTLSMDGTDPNASGNHRKNLRRSVEASLRRLGTDHIDLLWVHIWDPDTPLEETMRALDDVIRSGKVLYIGISDALAWVVARADTMAELRGWTAFTGLQLSYSLLQRDIERELIPASQALGLSVAAWAPLARGVLSGKFTRGQAEAGSRIKRDQIPEPQLAIAREVDAIADDLGATSSQVALAWTRAHHAWIHPIIGARTPDQMADSLAAFELELPQDAVRRLDTASAFDLGFPQDFIAMSRDFVYGEVNQSFQPRR
jgi:aryl-alcohol dehydrogenase-like predicted oxidoreductase